MGIIIRNINMSNFIRSSPKGVGAGEYVTYNGTDWVSKLINVNDIVEIDVDTPLDKQYLTYNGTDWVNKFIELDELADVTISAPINKDTLYFNGSEWVNQQLDVNDLSSVNISNPVEKDYMYFDGTNWINRPINVSNDFGDEIKTIIGDVTQDVLEGLANNKANTSTQVIAGTGLTGGGDLSANRTLNVIYGTTEGTAAQGNDTRLSNSREWTASTVSQAEAQAGTATTRSAWTSQRVRQNVANYTEPYTPAEKSKLSSLEGSKFKGEYISLAALNAAQPSPEVGSYAYVDIGVGEVVSKYIWDSSDAKWAKQQGETASLTPADVKSLYEVNPDTNAFSDSEKTKLGGIQSGAQVNVATNLGSSGTGATRTITSSTGSNTSITYSAADVGAVPTGRTITAGTGLTGGGDLSANRTLNVSYGTTAGTAAQGNDVRINNGQTAHGWGNHASAGYAKTKADVGLSGIPDTNASTANFLRGDGTWVTPPNTNTTYTEITAAEIDAGTASTLRTISGRRMKYALDKKANTGTQVIAGTGLTGGGNLTANRTLNVSYGTAAGTAAQGNDSRIDNGQTAFGWGDHATAGYVKTNTTYSTMSVSELRTGTVTTARTISAKAIYDAVAFIGLDSAATVTVNLSAGNNFTLNLAHNATLSNPTNGKSGQTGTIVITHNGARTLSYGANWKFPGGAPDLSTKATTDIITYLVVSPTMILAALVGDFS